MVHWVFKKRIPVTNRGSITFIYRCVFGHVFISILKIYILVIFSPLLTGTEVVHKAVDLVPTSKKKQSELGSKDKET